MDEVENISVHVEAFSLITLARLDSYLIEKEGYQLVINEHYARVKILVNGQDYERMEDTL